MRRIVTAAIGSAFLLVVFCLGFLNARPEFFAKREYVGDVHCPVTALSFSSDGKPSTVNVQGKATCEGQPVKFHAGWVDIPIRGDNPKAHVIVSQYLGKEVRCKKYEKTVQEKVLQLLAVEIDAPNFVYLNCQS